MKRPWFAINVLMNGRAPRRAAKAISSCALQVFASARFVTLEQLWISILQVWWKLFLAYVSCIPLLLARQCNAIFTHVYIYIYICDVIYIFSLFVCRGKYATVRRCRERSSGRQWAAKFLRKRRRAQELRVEALHEVAVLDAAAHCSRLVSLHQVFETNTEMVLVLEL